ncbi:hypothetical protein K435DRAFT_42100 [Dendrothele bispora CBS 962.96]|uniref:Uncharacterized protein n=1 Tax=Dendrothele bispora (strain CBS 962.96) TaxID=1314807 RepID=A0A4S8MUE5_DENBC|nr:hypothetical protein K435DRAFT_42100 [Dendrothele bispora CBS 962.96]
MSTSTHSSDPPEYTVSQLLRPPHYTRHTRPQTPLVYTFTPWSTESNSMHLIPPENVSGPTYKISATLNLDPFLPISYITNLEMLTDVEGEDLFVAQFELSLNQTRGLVTMGNVTTRLSDCLLYIDQSQRHWMWTLGNVTFRWDCRTTLDDGSPMCICYGSDRSAIQLATFVPPPSLAAPPLPTAVFTVFPDGHEFFEHIVLSVLIIQRKLTMVL